FPYPVLSIFRGSGPEPFVCNQGLVGVLTGYISVVAVVAVSLLVIQPPHGRCASRAAASYRHHCLDSDALVFPAAVEGLQEIAFFLIGRRKVRLVNVVPICIRDEAA